MLTTVLLALAQAGAHAVATRAALRASDAARVAAAWDHVGGVVRRGLLALEPAVRALKDPDQPGTWDAASAANLHAQVVAAARRQCPRELAVLVAASPGEDAATVLDALVRACFEEVRAARREAARG